MEVIANTTEFPSEGEIEEDDDDSESDAEVTLNSQHSQHEEEGTETEPEQEDETPESSSSSSSSEEEVKRKHNKSRKRKRSWKSDQRESMGKQIEQLTSAVVTMQQIILEKGNLNDSSSKTPDKETRGKQCDQEVEVRAWDSLTTIYHNAVPMVDEFNPESYERATKRLSNSSDDGLIDTSDDIFESINSHVNVVAGRK